MRTNFLTVLEPRIMFDGAMPTAIDGVISEVNTLLDSEATNFSTQREDEAFEEKQLKLADSGDLPTEKAGPVEIAIYDSNITDIADLISGLNDNVKAYALPSSDDPFNAINDILKQVGLVDAIHLITHGSEGAIELDGEQITQATLEAQADRLAQWDTYLTSGADILL